MILWNAVTARCFLLLAFPNIREKETSIMFNTCHLGFFFSSKLNPTSANTDAKIRVLLCPDWREDHVFLPNSAAHSLTWAPQLKVSSFPMQPFFFSLAMCSPRDPHTLTHTVEWG